LPLGYPAQFAGYVVPFSPAAYSPKTVVAESIGRVGFSGGNSCRWFRSCRLRGEDWASCGRRRMTMKLQTKVHWVCRQCRPIAWTNLAPQNLSHCNVLFLCVLLVSW